MIPPTLRARWIPRTCAAGRLGFPSRRHRIPTKAVWPYAQQWSFSVQRELPNVFVANAAYVGSKGTHLTIERQLNQLVPLPANENPFGPNEPLTLADCTMSLRSQEPVTPAMARAISAAKRNDRHAAESRLRPSAGGVHFAVDSECQFAAAALSRTGENSVIGKCRRFQLPRVSVHAAAYAAVRSLRNLVFYSHSIDDASDRSDPVLVDSYNLRENRASSNFDQRHLLNFSYIYQVPKFRPAASATGMQPRSVIGGPAADH